MCGECSFSAGLSLAFLAQVITQIPILVIILGVTRSACRVGIRLVLEI